MVTNMFKDALENDIYKLALNLESGDSLLVALHLIFNGLYSLGCRMRSWLWSTNVESKIALRAFLTTSCSQRCCSQVLLRRKWWKWKFVVDECLVGSLGKGGRPGAELARPCHGRYCGPWISSPAACQEADEHSGRYHWENVRSLLYNDVNILENLVEVWLGQFRSRTWYVEYITAHSYSFAHKYSSNSTCVAIKLNTVRSRCCYWSFFFLIASVPTSETGILIVSKFSLVWFCAMYISICVCVYTCTLSVDAICPTCCRSGHIYLYYVFTCYSLSFQGFAFPVSYKIVTTFS